MIFTFSYYKKIIESLRNAGYTFYCVNDYQSTQSTSAVVLRHDVDYRPWQAVRFAEMEHKLGVKSTYYIRVKWFAFNRAAVRRIVALGHEIGFHYECLADAKGDSSKAIQLFGAQLNLLRKTAPVTTIAMHGSSSSPYNNQEMWLKYKQSDFGIETDACDAYRYNGMIYATDTGMHWYNDASNFRDVISGTITPSREDARHFIPYLQSSGMNVYLQTHPDAWVATPVDLVITHTVETLLGLKKKYFKKNMRRERNGSAGTSDLTAL